MGIFFDLQRNLTTNVSYISKTQELLNKVIAAEKSGDPDLLSEAINNVLRHCHWNPSLFVPYFFPRYPKDEPMTLWSRPHAFSMMSLMSLGSMTIAASRQVGKCLTPDTEVLRRNSDGTNEKKLTIKELFDEAKAEATSK